jgi:hypothetical protein
MKSNEELAKDLKSISRKIIKLNSKMQDTEDDIKEGYDKTITALKGETSSLSRSIEDKAKSGSSAVYSSLIKAKMNYEVSKEEMQKKMAEKKFENEVAKAKYKKESTADYANFAVDYANWAIEEASLAVLEAKRADKEYKKIKK